MKNYFYLALLFLFLFLARPVEASHVSCSSSWPQYSISCDDPTRPYACGTVGGVGQCRSHAELPGPSTITGQAFSCTSCSWLCPAALPIICGSACSPRRSCADATRVTSNECTGACGSCRSGYIQDPPNSTGSCIAPTPAYINFNNPGELRIADSLRIIGTESGRGDLYLNSGKAIHIDAGGVSTLTIGNWGSGATGIDVNIREGRLIANTLCLGAECRSSWTAAEGGSVSWARLTGFPAACPSGQYVRAVGGTLTCEAPAVSGGGGLSGGAANMIAFWTGASSLSQNTNLHWDNTNFRLGVGTGTSTPAYTLDVKGDRIYLSNPSGNAEINLKSGSDQHWGIYSDQTSNELRFWKGNDRLKLTENGDLTVSGCLGATVAGATGGTYNGNLNGASAPADGYRGVDALCSAAFAGSHQCATEEVMTSIHCGSIWTDMTKTALRATIPAGVFAWIANGAPSLPTPTNDCYGWTQTGVVSGLQSQGIVWIFDARGGGGYARPCSEANRILCCR